MLNFETKAREYREYKRMIEELQGLADSIADEIKSAMNEAGESKLIIGEYKISYTDCTRRDLDKKRLEADHGDIYAAYTRETSYKRFAVA